MGYCDGWSEKQFDHGQAVVKCSTWIEKNIPSLAGNDVGEEITGKCRNHFARPFASMPRASAANKSIAAPTQQ